MRDSIKTDLISASRSFRKSCNFVVAYALLILCLWSFIWVNTFQSLRLTGLGVNIEKFFNRIGIRQEWSMFSGSQSDGYETLSVVILDRTLSPKWEIPIRDVSYKINLSNLIFQSGSYSKKPEIIKPLSHFYCEKFPLHQGGYILIKSYLKNNLINTHSIPFSCND